MANVIFKRPVRLGKINYGASKRSVQVDDAYLESRLMKALIKSGDVVIPPAAKAFAAPAKADKAAAPAKAEK